MLHCIDVALYCSCIVLQLHCIAVALEFYFSLFHGWVQLVGSQRENTVEREAGAFPLHATTKFLLLLKARQLEA